MKFPVSGEQTALAKALSAAVAYKRLCARMDMHVLYEVLFRCESLAANLARKPAAL